MGRDGVGLGKRVEHRWYSIGHGSLPIARYIVHMAILEWHEILFRSSILDEKWTYVSYVARVLYSANRTRASTIQPRAPVDEPLLVPIVIGYTGVPKALVKRSLYSA